MTKCDYSESRIKQMKGLHGLNARNCEQLINSEIEF